MNDNNTEKNLWSFIAGVAIGAFAVTMFDKDMREKLGNKVEETKEKGKEQYETVKDRALGVRDSAENKLLEKLEELQKKVEEMQKNRS